MGTYHEPAESSQHIPALFLLNKHHNYPPIHAQIFQLAFCLSDFPTKILNQQVSTFPIRAKRPVELVTPELIILHNRCVILSSPLPLHLPPLHQ
jgi:hypothetical protein